MAEGKGVLKMTTWKKVDGAGDSALYFDVQRALSLLRIDCSGQPDAFHP